MNSNAQQGLWGAFFAHCPNCSLPAFSGHGAGPSDPGDLAIVALGALILLGALALAVKFLFWPGESSKTHVKRLVLDDAAPPQHDGINHE